VLATDCREQQGTCVPLPESAVGCMGDDLQELLDALRPTGATIPNSARYAWIELMTAVCGRMKRWRAR
jgi:hypothetical protein